MSFTTFTSFPDTAAANAKIWGQATSTYLDTIHPKTTDTGQVDWNTYAAAPVVNTYPAYEIRRFSDSLQPSAPIVYKLEFGSLAGATAPSVRLTVGTGSDGVGNITGNKMAPFAVRSAAGSTSLTAISLLSGAADRINCALFATGNTQNAGMFFGIERTKDSLGNNTTEGAIVNLIAANGTVSPSKANQFVPFTGGVPASDFLGTMGAIVGNGTDGADVITFPNFPFRGSGFLNPGMNVEFYMNGSVNPGTVAPIERYGISRNYYFIGNITSFDGMLRGNAAWIANSTLAIRWE